MKARTAGLAAASLTLLLSAPLALAGPGRVFQDRPQQVLPGRHASMAIEGRVDSARIARGTRRLALQLPDGREVELARKSFRREHRDNATWRGTVAGQTRSDATLSVVDGRLAGRLRIGEEVFEIRPLAENEIRLQQLDMDSFPACDGGLPLEPAIAGEQDVLVDAQAARDTAAGEGTPRLDILVLYTAAAEVREGAAQIPATAAAAVATLNTVFANSQLDAEAVLVHVQRIEHRETGYANALQWLSSDPQVAQLRNQYAADMVALLVDLDGSCGIGWVPRTEAAQFNSATAFQVTNIDCAVGNLSFAHESGHNMGMEHNPENSGAALGQPYAPASYEHSFGHWVAGGPNAFRTVMSYADPCGSAYACPREEYFSNPGIYYQGTPTGTVGVPGVVNGRYNALTGNLTAPVIAQYRSPPAASGARDFAIQQGSDDAQQDNVSGEVTDNWTALYLGYYPIAPYNPTSVGLRFQNINVPRDATVTAAWLEFDAFADGADYAAATISVQDADDPPTFSAATPFDISARPRGASVRWDDIPPWTQGESNQSVDIAPLIQQVVDRAGWQANNALALILHDTTGTRWATSFNHPSGPAPRLHVEHRSCAATTILAGGSQWQSFSLPCLPRDNSVQQIFNGLDTTDYANTWAVFAHDAASDSYNLAQLTDPLQANTGYWYVNTGADFELTVSGRERRADDIPLYSVAPLVANLVGLTGMDAVPWREVAVVDGDRVLTLDEADPYLPGLGLACDQQPVDSQCVLSRKMYKWNGAAYQGFDGVTPGMEGALEPFDGAWVAAHKPGIALRLPTIAAAAEGDSAGDEPLEGGTTRSDRSEWSLRLTVASGEQSDPGNLLGRLASARPGKDAHDLEEPAPLGDSWLTLLFLNGAWEDEDNWGYTSDFRPAVRGEPRGTWRLLVKSSGEQREATLSWSGPSWVLKRARLVDRANRQVIRLHRQDSYTFPVNRNEQRFQLVITPQGTGR